MNADADTFAKAARFLINLNGFVADLFIRCLRLIAVPIVLFSLIVGASSLNDIPPIPAYEHQLLHGGLEERRRAAMALGRRGADAKHAVPTLIRALQDEEPLVIREVITALSMIGPAAKDAIPALEKLIDHQDKQIAERAKAALRQIRGK